MARNHDQLINARLSQYPQAPLNQPFTLDLNQSLGPTTEAAAHTGSQHNTAKTQPVSTAVTGLAAGFFGQSESPH